MATIKQFEDLEVWQYGRQLCRDIGRVIDEGNFKNNFKIVGQIEGSSGSVMDNIAEGFERGTRAEFIQFLGYAKGSCGELRSQLTRAFDRTYLNKTQYDDFYATALKISKMLQKFISYLQNTSIQGERKRATNLKR